MAGAPPGTSWPPELAAAMNDLRVSPHDIDPDDLIRLFVPAAHTVDQKKDRRLWNLAEKLAEACSAHNAATHLLETEPDWDFMAVYYRTVDEISHLFMPYHPPRMEGIPEADFELYKHVVTGIYKLHDLFLCRLMQLAGPETAIVLVSDHGFHSDHLRPKFTPRVPAGITVWHRPQGIFVASGPGLKRDELVFGAAIEQGAARRGCRIAALPACIAGTNRDRYGIADFGEKFVPHFWKTCIELYYIRKPLPESVLLADLFEAVDNMMYGYGRTPVVEDGKVTGYRLVNADLVQDPVVFVSLDDDDLAELRTILGLPADAPLPRLFDLG